MARRMASRSSRTRRTAALPTLYSRAVVCTMCNITEAELRLWESEELIRPATFVRRGNTEIALYDDAALRRARLITTLTEELEVNLPGISIILNLLEQFPA
jgi:MerR family transcriptional regulator/heat shock protein HspR